MSRETANTNNGEENKAMTRTELMIYAQQTYDKALATHKYNRHERLNTCQAHYVDVGNSVILKSYNTIVAIFNKVVGSLYVFDYYSATTQQHISKFAKMLDWDRISYLYKRSDSVIEKRYNFLDGTYDYLKPFKKSWENLVKYDFSMVITNRWD